MSLKHFFEHSFELIVIIFIFCISKNEHYFIKIFLACFFWLLRTHDFTFLYLTIILFSFTMPRYSESIPKFHCGRVVEVKEKYAIIKNNFQKIILYTHESPILDSEICYDGEYRKIQSTPSFYRFQFSKYANNKGIFYSIYGSHIKLQNDTKSMRGRLQKYILSKSDATSSLLLKVLLNITQNNPLREGLLNHSLLTFSGILSVLNIVLKRICYKDTRNRIISGFSILLCLFYHFPQILVQRFIFQLFQKTGFNSLQKFCFAILVIEFLYPTSLFTITFCLPILFRMRFLFGNDKVQKCYFYQLIIQSILFQKVNFLELLCFRFLTFVSGIIWYCALLFCFFPWSRLLDFIVGINSIFHFVDQFAVSGSVLGMGLGAYLLLLCILKKYSHYQFWRFVLFMFFYFFGLFHPFAEVTIINVGQGDSILIRAPLNLENQLIDTGKPSSLHAIQSLLNAKGIRHISHLYVTHQDLDHCGNQINLCKNYYVDHFMIEHYQNPIKSIFPLQDLSELKNKNKNQSGLIQHTKINGLAYLFMGDADFMSEKYILSRYPNITCDILKVSHHGSKYGSCDELLSTLNPKVAIISCDENNLYNHPHPETLERFRAWKIPVLSTKDDGDITILCFPFINLLITASGKIAII